MNTDDENFFTVISQPLRYDFHVQIKIETDTGIQKVTILFSYKHK